MAARTTKAETEAKDTAETTGPAIAGDFATTTPAPNAEDQAKAGKAAKKVVAVNEAEDTVTIEAVEVGDTANIARLLLDAAGDDRGVVQTISSPQGWKVPTAVAKAAGII